ncbi:hypothetical protein [Sphingobium sp. Sx8-8]|uniref:hypothetical protein n=1 Tax=Sphingobium sp. Sx8-8 TaxID=2933617 RepID=UPI001F56EB8C|nr:hypothetical protein [Sphingobium sp. Sx8-8]
MAFIADPAQRRTFDPERGLELISGPTHPDGLQNWWILCPNGIRVFFETVWEQDFINEWRRLNPEIAKPAIHLIRSLRGIIPGHDRDETDAIIIEALTVFGGFHGNPADSTVIVFFEPPGPFPLGHRWWKSILER